MFGQKLIAQLGLDSREFHSGIEGATKMVGGFNGVLQKIGIGLGIGAVLAFFKQVIDRGGELQDLSEQLGITTDSLQALDYAAKQAGLSGDTMGTVYNRLTVAGAEAADKSSSAAKGLAALAISAQEFNAASPDRKLEMVAKAYATAADKQAAFAAVSDLVGARSAPRLTAVLKELAEVGLDGVTKSAKEAGQVMDQATIKRMDALGDRIAALVNEAKVRASSLIGIALTLGDAIGGIFDGKLANSIGTIAAGIVNSAEGIKTSFGDAAEAADRVEVAVESAWVAMKGTEATSADLKRLDEARAKLREKEMTDAEKRIVWLDRLLVLESEKARFQQNSKEYVDAETESLAVQTKIIEQQAAIEKKAGDEAKKRGEEAKKLAEDAEKTRKEAADRHIATMDKLEGLQFARLSTEEKIAKLAATEAEILRSIAKAKREGADTAEKEVSLIETQNALSRERANLAADTASKEKETVASLTAQEKLAKLLLISEREQTDEIRRQIFELRNKLGLVAQINSVGKSYQAQSTESLEYVQRNLTKRLGPLENEKLIYGYSPMLYAVQSELNQLKAELAARSQFQNTMRLGDDFTKRMYSPQEFARLSQATGPAPTEDKRIADTLDEINTRLKPVFKK